MAEDPIITRKTLLLRMRDSADDEAWSEFVEVYTPILYAYCRKRELSQADTADIVQEVMRSVSIAMKGFEYDPSKGKFRGWLFTAVRHAISRHYRKQAKRPVTASETRLVEMIEQTPDENEIDEWERDYRFRLLGWVIEKIEPEFSERIWSAFRETAMKGRERRDVAAELNMSENAVTIAKHRVVKRLKEKAESIDAEHWEDEMILRMDKNS